MLSNCVSRLVLSWESCSAFFYFYLTVCFKIKANCCVWSSLLDSFHLDSDLLFCLIFRFIHVCHFILFYLPWRVRGPPSGMRDSVPYLSPGRERTAREDVAACNFARDPGGRGH